MRGYFLEIIKIVFKELKRFGREGLDLLFLKYWMVDIIF